MYIYLNTCFPRISHRRRWLQDTSKRKFADFLIVFVPPPLPVSPGSPEVHPTIDQDKRVG